MNEDFEKLYETMLRIINMVIKKYGGMLKMEREDLEQELLILLFQIIEKLEKLEDMDSKKAYYYKSCVYKIYRLSLQEHKQGLWLQHSNIMNDDGFDIFDTYIDNGIDYVMKDEFVERYYQKLREYYKSHREQIIENQKKYNKSHKEKIREIRKKYYRNHRKECLKKGRDYYESHREDRIEYQKKYNKSHKEERCAKAKTYYERHKEEIKAKARENYHKKKQQAEENLKTAS